MKLDFNALEQPTLELTLKDPDKTVIHATVPTEELVERLVASASGLKQLTESKSSPETAKALYSLIAELMNCNREGLTFTAEELRDKYNLTLYDAFVFAKVYMEFVQEMQGAKN